MFEKLKCSLLFVLKKEVFKTAFGSSPGSNNILQLWPVFLRH